jgi:hypothetical protein
METVQNSRRFHPLTRAATSTRTRISGIATTALVVRRTARARR